MKRKKILTVSLLAALFAVVAGFAVQGHSRAAQYEQLLENSYTHAYYELTTAVSELDTALQKARYTATPVMLEALCADIYGKTVCAQMALSELPNSGAALEQTAAFLARTGDYAFALSKTAALNRDSIFESHATLQDLCAVSSALSSALLDVQSDLAGGGITIEALLQAENALAQQTHDGEAAQGGTTFRSIEADFPETPTLIYDGPFSEHLSSRTPLALEGLPQSSRDEARATAAAFLGLRPEVLTPLDGGNGILPVWAFSATVDGGELYIEVTQQGCKVISLFSSRVVTDAIISIDDALTLARTFLTAQGYGSMQESYHINQGNVLTVNFAPVDDGVLCYPDLVKVSVALDTGSVIGFESHGWIMNHTDRTFPAAAVSAEAARTVISPELEILSHRMTLIPTGGEYEVLCHEFKCKTPQDTHVIVYINATTGNEEQIFLLLEDESGTLVW